MTMVHETTYPQLPALLTERELREIYQPTPDERILAEQHTSGPVALVAFLVLLKTYQRLGYAVALTAVPPAIVTFIAQHLHAAITTADLIGYDASGTRRRHLPIIRDKQGLTKAGEAAQGCSSRVCGAAHPVKRM